MSKLILAIIAGADGVYTSKNGTDMFVYRVSGSAADLAKYAEIKGVNHRTEADGTPKFFSNRYVGETAELVFTPVSDRSPLGNVKVDDSAMVKARSIANQAGGDFGAAVAKDASAALFGNLFSRTASAPAPAPKTEPEVVHDDLDNQG